MNTVKAAITTKSGASQNTHSIGRRGRDVFFNEKLQGVRDGLQQTVRTNTHRSQTNLHVGQNFALQPVHGDDGD